MIVNYPTIPDLFSLLKKYEYHCKLEAIVQLQFAFILSSTFYLQHHSSTWRNNHITPWTDCVWFLNFILQVWVTGPKISQGYANFKSGHAKAPKKGDECLALVALVANDQSEWHQYGCGLERSYFCEKTIS